jgi:hypothetical protein
VFLTLLRPKQGQKSGDILDTASNRRTERNRTGHNKRNMTIQICDLFQKVDSARGTADATRSLTVKTALMDGSCWPFTDDADVE